MSTGQPPLTSERAILRACQEFELTLNAEQVLQIQQYMAMLLAWNDKVNLTAIRDPLEILNRHFCESMFGASLLPKTSCRLADVGSGGGFPGLPLKIIRPDNYVFLIESSVKKATFLAEVVRELKLTDTRVLVSRYEELGEEVAPLDVVCSRALGEFEGFLQWAGGPRVGAQEVIFWIGKSDAEAIRGIPGWRWGQVMDVPRSLRRCLLAGHREVTNVGATT
ncbi:MAG TPA: 16S rRNA (guanine(527)-N(7))-methyltransferase RsmG [Terriglobales bacterium]|nr:16S rRNA (guanine(527)-N(7))-methyltransferase RsmG [Terriglobales bacterium]